VSEIAIDHACRAAERRAGRPASGWQALEEGFVLSEGHLEIPHRHILEDRPVRLLSAFAVAQRHDVKLSPRSERLVRNHLSLIDDGLREDPEAAAVFRGILSAPTRVYRTLLNMNELGVLGAYLPEFGDLVGLWQQDLYHTYTVDIHSLFLIEQLRRLERGRFTDELPLASKLMQEVRARDVLFLGCLLHDIGKGKGGGHSARGANMIPEVGRRLGLNEEEIEDVQFLVLHHLHMSRLAERRDVHDPRLILNLATLVENRRRLRNLYLLTVADIRSVSAEAWTTWKAGLLEALYRNTAEWLEAEISDEAAPRYFLERAIERSAEVVKEVMQLLTSEGLTTDRASDLLDSLPKRYVLLHRPIAIAEHLRWALDYLDSHRPVGVYVRAVPGSTESCEMIVFAADRPGLLAIVAGLLRAAGRNILSAYVYTTREGLAMEIYRIFAVGGPAEEDREREKIERRLLEVLGGELSVEALIASRRKLLPAPARIQPPSVRISNEDSDLYSIVDVVAQDRPGLLYDITRALADLGLNVAMSRVSTQASRISDAFYVTDQGLKILDTERREEIRSALLAAVETTPS
jgi:[protein-PII] uridylyltransferase